MVKNTRLLYKTDNISLFKQSTPRYENGKNYICNNEMLKNIDVINIENIIPIVTNWIVILAFSMVFALFANFASMKKRKCNRQ